MPTTPLTRPYCTKEQVREEIRNQEQEIDDLLDQTINLASRRIEELCFTDFWYHDHSADALDIPDEWIIGKDIYFPWPIQASPAVVLTFKEDALVLDSEDYTVFGGINASTNSVEKFGRIRIAEAYSNTSHIPLFTITGKFGTTLEGTSTNVPPTNLPASVNRACVLLAAAWCGHNQKQIIGLGLERAELFTNEVPKEVKQLLTRWKVHRSSL